jgi:hypothetical protein
MANTHSFAADYSEARDKFLAAARVADPGSVANVDDVSAHGERFRRASERLGDVGRGFGLGGSPSEEPRAVRPVSSQLRLLDADVSTATQPKVAQVRCAGPSRAAVVPTKPLKRDERVSHTR